MVLTSGQVAQRSGELFVVVSLCAVMSAGCHRDLVRPISCEQIARIDVGLTRTDVQRILGPPSMRWSTDYQFPGGRFLRLEAWEYSRDQPQLATRRDTMTVLFHGDVLAVVAASRKEFATTSSALYLVRNPTDPAATTERKQGPAFAGMFHAPRTEG